MCQIKRYSELITIPTYKERLEYLWCGGKIGVPTFGGRRYLNQVLYSSPEWKHFRRQIIIRDKGCDLALESYKILDCIYIHHIVPLTEQDVLNRNSCIFDDENVVCVSKRSHDFIHYGCKEDLQFMDQIERHPNDTCPWR